MAAEANTRAATVESTSGHPAGVAFDALAPSYDDRFSRSAIGRHLREAVRRRLLARFRAGQHVLEINCGTGDDAVWLAERGVRVLATDVSAGMIAAAAARVRAAVDVGGARDVDARVEVRRVAIESIDDRLGSFDGLLSNFGGLNCVALPLDTLFARLAGCVRPGGFAMLCVMGPRVPWEWLWYLARRQPRVAFRRLRADGVEWRGVRVRYPSIGALTRAAAPWFVRRRVAAIGALVPPTYAEAWAAQHTRALGTLARIERRCETWRPLPDLADHYLVELERTARPAADGPRAEHAGDDGGPS